MSVAKVIELTASSAEGIEQAVAHGLKKCSEAVKNIQGAWVNDIKVVRPPTFPVCGRWMVTSRAILSNLPAL